MANSRSGVENVQDEPEYFIISDFRKANRTTGLGKKINCRIQFSSSHGHRRGNWDISENNNYKGLKHKDLTQEYIF